MKIEKFSKNKNGMYILTIENGTKIKIHEDLILKYELLLSKEITPSLLETINSENQIYELYELSLKYLKIRLRGKKELEEYLLKKGYSKELIDSTVELLQKQGYLDDKSYTNAFIHDKILMSSAGPEKIKSELEKNGISCELIEKCMPVFTKELEKERVEKIVKKQIQTNHNKGSILLKRKIQMYLINLGYSNDIINECLNGRKLVSEDLYQKEYEKLYTKLSKKYEGKELEYRLKQKMYQKGFSNNNEE